MMRFILDCLRPGRQRSSCARENSVEIQTKERETANDTELKELEDVVAMEEGALQRERAESRDAQQALESLAQRRTQLTEHIEAIQEQRKQEGQLLLSLQEEKEELEQTVQEYEAELRRAKEDLEHLHEDISGTRARVEDAHGRMGSLKHSIGETYTEISEAKQRLGELIAEMIAIEACVPEVTQHHADEPMRMTLDDSREEEDDEEKCYNHIYCSVEKEHFEQEHNEDGLEKLQRSAENLKSSGSSSFTEITLTEVKEDASPKSITPQRIDSPDMEEEDFEIVQSLATNPVSQSTREFDFYHPDPFVDHDVFGDERFPKVDMTEFLSGDPFKGTDPFASDMYFNDVAEAQFPQDYLQTEESDTKESNSLSIAPVPTSSKDHNDESNTTAPMSARANCSQSIDSGMFDQNVPDPSDSERYTPYSDICPESAVNLNESQDLDSVKLYNSTRAEFDPPESSLFDNGGRFDPIHCDHLDIHDSASSNSSTADSSFDGDFGTFTGMEVEPEPEPEVERSYVRRNQALYGLQRIDTSTYTSFPLSPEAYDPEPDVPVPSDSERSVQVADPFTVHSEAKAVSELKSEIEDPESVSPFIEPSNPDTLCQEFGDVSCDPQDVDQSDNLSHSAAETDSYDHKFGDIYFFTVRLDPGSPDASPISAEANDAKKSECDQASPESNDTDEFDYGGTQEEHPNHYGVGIYSQESSDEMECEVKAECTISAETNEPLKSESETRNSRLLYLEAEAGLDPLEGDMRNLESNITENMENVGSVCSADTNSKDCHNEQVVQYLISPVSADTGMSTTEGHKLCAHNPFSLESGSIEHCENVERNPDAYKSEGYIAKELDSSDTMEKDPEGDIAKELDSSDTMEKDRKNYIAKELGSSDTLEKDPESYIAKELDSSDTLEKDPESYIVKELDSSDTLEKDPESYIAKELDSSDTLEKDPESYIAKELDLSDTLEKDCEGYIAKKLDLCDTQEKDLDLFGSIPMNNITYKFEVQPPNSVNSVSTDSGRLDSGYHENNELDPFSPVPAEMCPNMGSASVTHQPEIVSSGNLDQLVSDPFSPEPNEGMIFDSEHDLCNSATNEEIRKDSGFVHTASSDVLGDSFSGSELESFDPFSPVPHLKESVSLSSQLPCVSAQSREDAKAPFVTGSVSFDAYNMSYSSNCSTKDSLFDTDFSIVTDGGSFKSEITEQDKNSSVSATGVVDLAEIDFFCTELSRMVASRSTDTVQQSVAEMLFGSNPDTTKFYPWDLENSEVVTVSTSDEEDFGNGNKLIKDLPKFEAGPRSHMSGDLLGEFLSATGNVLDAVETPSLL